MSTRAVYTFKDEHNTFAVYGHYDGYPSGAADALDKAREFAWPGQRFEAMDYAAAFIAANKTPGGGGVYVTKGHKAHGDLEYDYVISRPLGVVIIEAFAHHWSEETGEKRVRFFKGALAAFIKEYAEKEAA